MLKRDSKQVKLPGEVQEGSKQMKLPVWGMKKMSEGKKFNNKSSICLMLISLILT